MTTPRATAKANLSFNLGRARRELADVFGALLTAAANADEMAVNREHAAEIRLGIEQVRIALRQADQAILHLHSTHIGRYE